MRGHVMAPHFSLSSRATDVRPKDNSDAPTSSRLGVRSSKEREYFKTCIVGHVNCCLQCGSTLNLWCEEASTRAWKRAAVSISASSRFGNQIPRDDRYSGLQAKWRRTGTAAESGAFEVSPR
ncbi:hypothetical protein PoB_001122300 [Plakobranchus ocellatus]|uniref:Uncharacterized protein n=1 Tax=Plakobranchus ocellatus TaxID=259542 RepID=A0AAV3YQV0_9GAST|nr:hypothetical protein PoB_001122300 [Plakobranchus ocellatus]